VISDPPWFAGAGESLNKIKGWYSPPSDRRVKENRVWERVREYGPMLAERSVDRGGREGRARLYKPFLHRLQVYSKRLSSSSGVEVALLRALPIYGRGNPMGLDLIQVTCRTYSPNDRASRSAHIHQG